MTLLFLAALAHGAPPAAEVMGGWAGNADQGYGYVTAQSTAARNDEASLFVRGGASHLQYRYYDGIQLVDVQSPGASLGVGFAYTPGDLAVSVAASFETRITTRTAPLGGSVQELEPGGVLSSSVFWEPKRRTSLYAIGSFSGANAYLWARGGVTRQVVPRLRRDTAFQLWLGADATAHGNADARATEVGGVVEVRSRDLRTSLALRAGWTFEDAGDRQFQQNTIGLSAYWWYPGRSEEKVAARRAEK